MRVNFDNVGRIGVVADRPADEIPQDAWSDARNIRFRDNYAEKMTGESVAFSATATPIFAVNVRTPTDNLWAYHGLSAIYATIDNTTHVDISRASGYAATVAVGWNGGRFNGYGIFNNGIDPPQSWDPSLGNACQNLQYDASSGATNADWGSAGAVVRVMRPFKQFLVGLDVTDPSGTRNDSLVWWSHPADPGDLPFTWDFGKPAYDAGRVELESEAPLIDCLRLRDTNVIYKQDSTWAQRFIGAPNIFRFDRVFEAFGALGRRCAIPFFGKHLTLATDDVVLHDLQNVDQVLTSKMNSFIFSQIDTDNFGNSFLVANYPEQEVWVCFPTDGETYPNLAVVWNWRFNTTTVRELNSMAHIASGIVDTGVSSIDFDNDTGTFDEAEGAFDEATYNPTKRKILLVDPANQLLLLGDDTNQFNGTNMTAYAQRTGLPLGRQDARGSIRVDTARLKQILAVYPRIRGTTGNQVTVRIGGQSRQGGPVNWAQSKTFTIGTDYKVDFRYTTRLPAIEFRSTNDQAWFLDGYSVIFEDAGEQ